MITMCNTLDECKYLVINALNSNKYTYSDVQTFLGYSRYHYNNNPNDTELGQLVYTLTEILKELKD